MKRRINSLSTKLLIALFVACLMPFQQAVGQSSSGGGAIQGTVKDEAGAAIAGAKVIIKNEATGFAQNLVTNESGYYVTPTLPIGVYTIRVEARDMKSWEGKAQVETARSASVDVVMVVGQVGDTVTIEGSVAPLVNTAEPTEGSTLDSKRIKELPINGRNINTLIEDVTPGVEGINNSNGGVRVGGLMVYGTNYVQDGATTNNIEIGGSGVIQGLESIGEVRVETSTSSARYTTPTSVIITTKGGGNQFHGSLYETHRNNAFGVARARQDVLFNGQEFKAPHLIRNEFGGSISGPVYLPRFGEGGKAWYDGHDRTFFFFSREGLRLRQGITRDFSVPTLAMRQGDFSQLIDSQGRLQILYDPLTTRQQTINGRQVAVRDPFPNNQIPISRISPLAKYLFSITPLPNIDANPLTGGNLRIAVPTSNFPNRDDDLTTVRLDHRLSEKDSGFFKVSGGKSYYHFIGNAGGIGAPTANNEANVTYLPMESIAGALSWSHTFSPTFFVETLFNRTWQSTKVTTGPPNNQQNFSEQLGLPNNFSEIGFPSITGIGLSNYSYVEGDNRRALYSIVTNLEQNYTLVRGTHNIQFGGNFHNERNHLLPDQGGISGSAAFNSGATALQSPTLGSATAPQTVPQTGYDLANFFLGYAARYEVGLKRGFMQVYEKKFGLYLQDNWRVNDRLTFTPGLRWDINPAFHERNKLLSAFDVENHALLLPESLDYYYKIGATTPELVNLYQDVGVKFESAADVGKSSQLFNSNLYNFSPRAGFAYRMFDGSRQLVLRGGYGVYTAAIPFRTLLSQFSGLLPFRTTFSYNPNAAAQSPDGIPSYLLRTTPTIVAGVNSADAVDVASPLGIGRGQSVVGLAEDQPAMRVHEWNLTVEKQISSNTVVRFTYNGKHGVNADQLFEINPQGSNYIYHLQTGQPLPSGAFANVIRRVYDQNAYTSVRILQKTGYINSATWTAQVERRFTKGLGFQAFYTLTNLLRYAGNSFRDDIANIYHPSLYLSGTVPTDQDQLNRTLFYDRDTEVPKHRIRWNWNYDLPFGKGQKFLGSSGGFLNGLIGGWKFAGAGTILSTWYSLPTNNWGEFGQFEVYDKKYKIEDCRATPSNATQKSQELCTPGYLYFNGYISPLVINRSNAAGVRTGVFGLPDNYKPAQKPINAYPNIEPGTTNTTDTNNVRLTLNNGSAVTIGVDTGYHPWRNQYRLGPWNWVMDASLLKVFTIKERYKLRVNFDLFNVFNIQGLNTPNAEGIASLGGSYNPATLFGFKPRQLQGTLRFEW